MSQTAAGNVQANQPYPAGIGDLSASSISLTASNGVTPTRIAPIRLFNNLVELDVYTGSGTPTFSAQTGSLFLQNDTANVYLNTSASPSGTTWSLIASQSGTGYVTLTTTQTVSGAKTFSATLVDTNTTLSFQGSGPIQGAVPSGVASPSPYAMLGFESAAGAGAKSDSHTVFASVNINASTTTTITLTNDAVYSNNIQMVAVADGATPANSPTCTTISLSSFSIKNNDAGSTRTCRYLVMGD